MIGALVGFLLLLCGHALLLAIGFFATKSIPLNGHVVVLSLMGGLQLVYGLPLVVVLWRKRKNEALAGALIGMLATIVVNGVGLTL